MKKYALTFLRRGLMFAGFGPIITSVVFFILSKVLDNFYLTADQVLLSTASTFLLAFVQAGASVFNQIEDWSIGKSLLLHFSTLYFAYILCYIANSWIPFIPFVIIIFTIVFTILYFLVWFTVYFSVRAVSSSLNEKLKKS